MVCRHHGLMGGQPLQLWLGFFFSFLNPLPEFTPRLATCRDEVITEDSFSPSKISPTLRCLILLLRPEHIKKKKASIKWHYLHKSQLPQQSISNTAIQSSVKGMQWKKGGKKDMKKRGILIRALLQTTVSHFRFTSRQTIFSPLLSDVFIWVFLERLLKRLWVRSIFTQFKLLLNSAH